MVSTKEGKGKKGKEKNKNFCEPVNLFEARRAKFRDGFTLTARF